MNEIKIERLERFLGSSLASELWESSPQKVSSEFLRVWEKLAQVMWQKAKDKTIAFAMKCLGISLLIAEEYSFNFGSIPIPVDSRVVSFTEQLVFHIDKDEEVRKLWDEILSTLRMGNPHITMIHLDSLVWQIAQMSRYELQKYFKDMGIPHIGDRLFSLLQSTTDIR